MLRNGIRQPLGRALRRCAEQHASRSALWMLQKNVPAGWANSPVEGSPPAHRGSGERGLSGRGGFWGFMDAAAGRKFMGKDQHGNTYWEIKNPGGKPDPKRQIDYVEKNMEEIEWHEVPPEWRLWVRYARALPPTDQELRFGEAQRAYTQKRAVQIAEEDERLRSYEIAMGTNLQQDAVDPMLLIQRSMRGDGGRPAEGGAEAERPARGTASSSPTGSGKTFKPGIWDPTQ